MAVRNESVRLSLQDDFSSGMARAAAITAVLNRELDDLDKTSIRSHRSVGPLGDDVDSLGASSRRTGNDINKLTGRLALARDAALTLGPALVPLGAAAVGGLVTMAAQLGATAGALGVTLLAVHGLSDGLKALDEYQLDPTAENLAKLREELDKLGPSGEHFVRYLDSIEGELDSLQTAARNGLLPGLEEGIDGLLQRLPQLRRLIRETAVTMGQQASDAGAALGGEQFDAFFEYLRSDGIQILDDTARTVGNLTLAGANLMAVFAPLQLDFSGGLLDWSERLAQASEHLDESAGLQEFIRYVEENGPLVVDTLASVANAALQIVEAAAPLGGPVLTALKGISDTVALIADSDLGTPILLALGALSLYNRSLAITTKLQETSWGGKGVANLKSYTAGLLEVTTAQERAQMSATQMDAANKRNWAGLAKGGLAMGGLAASLTGVAEGAGLSNTAMLSLLGPYGTAAGYAIDLAQANGKAAESIDEFRASLAAAGDDLVAQQAAVDGFSQRVTAMQDDLDTDSFGEFFKNAFDPDVAVAFTRESFGMKTGADQAADALAAEAERLDGLRDGSIQAFRPVSSLAAAMKDNAEAAQDEADAIQSSVDAMRAQRQEALRALDAQLNYQAAIDDANKSLKENGRNFGITTEKGRENRQALYALADGWNQQSDAAKNAKGSLQAARQNFIDTAKQMGATAEQAKRLADRLFEIKPKNVDVNVNVNGQADVDRLNAALSRAVSKTITLTVNRVGNALSGFGIAGGGTVPGPRFPYGDSFPAMLAPGEEVISNRHGQADRFRADRAAGRIPGYAAGGTAADTYTHRQSPQGFDYTWPGRGNGHHADEGIQLFVAGAWSAAKALKAMNSALDKSEKALDKQRSKLDELLSARSSLSSSATSALLHDPFGNGLAGFQAQNAADAADSSAMLTALQTLVRNGLDPKGALFQALAASGDVNTAQQMAALTSTQLFAEQASFDQTHALAGQTGQFAASGLDPAIRDLEGTVKDLRGEIKHFNHAINQMAKDIKQAAHDGTKSGAHEGTKDGIEGRERQSAAHHRTGGGRP